MFVKHIIMFYVFIEAFLFVEDFTVISHYYRKQKAKDFQDK